MKKRKKIRNKIIIVSSILLLVIFVFLVIYLDLFKFQASPVDNAEYITAQADVTYQDTSGAAYSESSNLLKIRKVTLFPVGMQFQGRTSYAKGMTASISFTERVAPFGMLGTKEFAYDYGTNKWSAPDWTSLSSINPDQPYDLTISSPGYLSREIPNQVLANLASVAAAPLLAGNVYLDNTINYSDYTKWNMAYGKDVVREPNYSIYDYNGDNLVNYKDFAIAFGSNNYGKTVTSQSN